MLLFNNKVKKAKHLGEIAPFYINAEQMYRKLMELVTRGVGVSGQEC